MINNCLPILLFHSIDDAGSPISYPVRRFEHCISRLCERGFHTLTLAEVVDCLAQGKPFQNKSLVITFDDGYQTVYTQAFPVLQRHGMSATVFLTVGKRVAVPSFDRLPSLEGQAMLAWSEIREMKQGGIEFGAHTLTHPDLTQLRADQVESEVCDSKSIIEGALGTKVSHFAYPHGRFNPSTYAIAKQHFVSACSGKIGLVTSHSDLYSLRRIDAHYDLNTDWLLNIMVSRLFPWYVRLRSVPRRMRQFKG